MLRKAIIIYMDKQYNCMDETETNNSHIARFHKAYKHKNLLSTQKYCLTEQGPISLSCLAEHSVLQNSLLKQEMSRVHQSQPW